MNTLNLLKPFAKPLIALLVLVFLYFAFQYYNHIQQKIGQLEQQLIQKQEQLQTQNQNIENIRTQLLKQYQAIVDLQKVQSEIQTSAGQRQVLLFMGTLIISQNAEVLASEAIMGRIVHVKFFKDQLTKSSLYASRNLTKYEPEDVSHFILDCLNKEKDILEAYNLCYEEYDVMLHQEQHNIQSSRIVHNHAQFMALFDAMCRHVIEVPVQIQKQVHAEFLIMAQNRDKVLKSDPVIVQNFWNTIEEMESSINKLEHHESVLNHSNKSELFAINFAHLYRVAADYRYALPEMNELQNALRHSMHYRFIEANKAIQSKLTNSTKRCWIFEKPTSQRD